MKSNLAIFSKVGDRLSDNIVNSISRYTLETISYACKETYNNVYLRGVSKSKNWKQHNCPTKGVLTNICGIFIMLEWAGIICFNMNKSLKPYIPE